MLRLRAVRISGVWMMARRPRSPIETNQSTMIGPKRRPIFSVPRRWMANRATRIPSVPGTTNRCMSASMIESPSTAPSTEIAGVMSASQ